MKKGIKKIIVLTVALVVFAGCFGESNVYAAKKKSTYMVSPHSLKIFKKKGKKLYVKSKDGFMKNNKHLKKKVLKFKIAKKCKWRYKNEGNRFPKAKGIQKYSYKKMKKLIYQDMQIPDNGYHTIVIKVKKKKIISVTYESI